MDHEIALDSVEEEEVADDQVLVGLQANYRLVDGEVVLSEVAAVEDSKFETLKLLNFI